MKAEPGLGDIQLLAILARGINKGYKVDIDKYISALKSKGAKKAAQRIIDRGAGRASEDRCSHEMFLQEPGRCPACGGDEAV